MLPNTFYTARLTLRLIMPGDAGPIFDGYAQDTTVTRFVIWRPHRSLSDTEAYIAQCLDAPPDVSRTYVLTEVVNWALSQPSIFCIGAVCDVENIGSARVMEKAGLVREGLLRRWLMHPNISDEPRDCFSYARAR